MLFLSPDLEIALASDLPLLAQLGQTLEEEVERGVAFEGHAP